MANDDSNLIVRLVALNEKTRNAWKDPHNASFYVPVSLIASEHREGSRPDTGIDEIESPDSEPEIRLTLNDFPKDLSEGFMFGQDKDSCDICSDAFNVSRQVFSITINKKCQVVLKHLTPKTRISVQYGDQEPGVRRLSTWILFPECKKGIIIKVAQQLKFLIIVPDHGTLTEKYRQGCLDYLTNVESAVAILPSHHPPATNPIQMPTRNTKPFYYRCVEKELGSSKSGKVYLVYDASTGEEFAGKELKCGKFDHDLGRIWISQNHVNINSFVDFVIEGGPLLVMHYVQGGNLARPWRIKDQDSWSPIEIAGVLYQCLNALAYLHAETDTIHWRIKPENVLVERRYPRVRGLHVKIGEIGLDESSEVGIWTYTAPEALTGGPYGKALEIWSMGAVVMQMLAAGRLPNPQDSVAHGPAWCGILENVAVKYATALGQQNQNAPASQARCLFAELWSFIATYMLKVDPKRRSTAKECLEAGKLTVFRFFQETEVEAQRTPTGRQHGDEDGTYENGTDEVVSDEDATAGLPALPDQATHQANSEAGVTPDYALQKQHQDRMMGYIRNFMTSDLIIPESDGTFGWDPKRVRY